MDDLEREKAIAVWAQHREIVRDAQAQSTALAVWALRALLFINGGVLVGLIGTIAANPERYTPTPWSIRLSVATLVFGAGASLIAAITAYYSQHFEALAVRHYDLSWQPPFVIRHDSLDAKRAQQLHAATLGFVIVSGLGFVVGTGLALWAIQGPSA